MRWPLGDLWVDSSRTGGPAFWTLDFVTFEDFVCGVTTHAFVLDCRTVHVFLAEDGFDFGKDTHGLST